MVSNNRNTLLENISFTGHKNVLATNRSTLEVTTENFLTLRGDCIIGVNASKSCEKLSERTKSWLQKDDHRVLIRIEVANESFLLTAFGSAKLTHTNDISMVIRKSDFTCHRTLAIKASASAIDIPRTIVALLRKEALGSMQIYAVP
jgi:hypothetical protein